MLIPASQWLDEPGALAAFAAANGYLYLPALADERTIAPLRERAMTACAARGWLEPGARLHGTGYDDPAWISLQQELVPAPEFLALGDHPAVLAVLEALYQAPVETRRGDICRIFLPGAEELTTPPHQDHFYLGGSTDVWTAWWPLTDCPRALGPLAVLPASHLAGPRPHAGEDAGRQGIDIAADAAWAAADLACGDVVLFNCLTIHRALPNTTARPRVSVDYRYQPYRDASVSP